jgi:hypothetical protein
MLIELIRPRDEHTQTLWSSVLKSHFKRKQDGILFSLYYLGLKLGQRVNKDGILLYLEN